MYLRRKIAITSIVFILLSISLTFVLALTSDYKYNDVSYNGAVEQKKQLIDDLDIENSFFLLTPKVYLNYKLKGLEYIDSVEIDRVLPNEVEISFKTTNPKFCDDETLYFIEQTFEKSVQNENLCVSTPEIVNYSEFSDYIAFVEEYKNLSIDFRFNVEKVESIDNYFEFTMSDGLVINIFLEDFSNLNKYSEYQVTDLYLDLRPKYS